MKNFCRAFPFHRIRVRNRTLKMLYVYRFHCLFFYSKYSRAEPHIFAKCQISGFQVWCLNLCRFIAFDIKSWSYRLYIFVRWYLPQWFWNILNQLMMNLFFNYFMFMYRMFFETKYPEIKYMVGWCYIENLANWLLLWNNIFDGDIWNQILEMLSPCYQKLLLSKHSIFGNIFMLTRECAWRCFHVAIKL